MNIGRGASAPGEQLRLGGKARALLAGMLSGVSDAAELRALAGLASHGALRQHMHRLRCALARGGVESRRFPTRYWLSPAAVKDLGEGLKGEAP